MNNFNETLDMYNFHDSLVNSIVFEPCTDEGLRKLVIDIDYYNWEGNDESNDTWTKKKLLFKIEHCILLRYEFPNLMSRHGSEINDIELKNDDVERINNFHNKFKTDKCYNDFPDKEFENCFSVKFHTHSSYAPYGEKIFEETGGYLWVAGFNGKIESVDSYEAQKSHIGVG
jgi:hypothetical protein